MDSINDTVSFSGPHKTENNEKRVLNRTIPLIVTLSIIAGTAVFISALILFFIRDTMKTLPDTSSMSNIRPSLVSKVYAADSTLIHEFSIERRFWVPLDSIPEHLKNAVIAIEDRRFRQHWGVDTKRMGGAMFKNILKGRKAEGASTLTQQLTRNAFFSHDKTVIRKVREILTAVQMEKIYTKDEILELYLNMVYLGGGAYGMEAAAQRYFSKSVTEIDINEAAILAGSIQRPEKYRPDFKKNHKDTKIRRNSVLTGMVRAGFLDKNIADSIKQIAITAKPATPDAGKAPYFVEEVRKILENKYNDDLLYNGGLSIYTTCNVDAQIKAEKDLIKHLDTVQRAPNRLFISSNRAWEKIGVPRDTMYEHFDSLYNKHIDVFDTLHDSLKLRELQSSIVVIENNTGAVRILVGGKDFYESRFNRATQSNRQPGSAFKPFVYASALQNGYTPVTKVIDKPVTIKSNGQSWRPENFEKEFFGPISISNALKRSVNLVAIQILLDVGYDDIIGLARKMGLEKDLPVVPSLAIGACEATNMELTSAYTGFANNGHKHTPYLIESITDKNGREIYRHKPDTIECLSPQVAFLMVQMMRGVVDGGTAMKVRQLGFHNPAAGKTGTTNSYSDAWFVGYTKQYSCGVWTGADQRRPMGHGVTGTYGAVPLWTSVMKTMHKGLRSKRFNVPKGVVSLPICKETSLIANDYCPHVSKTYFLSNNRPSVCDKHQLIIKKDKSNVINYFGSSRATVDEPEDTTDSDDIDGLIF